MALIVIQFVCDFSTWVCFSPYLRETERLCSHGRNPDWQTPLSGCPWTHSLECQTASSGLPSNAEKTVKTKTASLLYILEGFYEQEQKVCRRSYEAQHIISRRYKQFSRKIQSHVITQAVTVILFWLWLLLKETNEGLVCLRNF